MGRALKTLIWVAALAALVYGAHRASRAIRARKQAAGAATAEQALPPPPKVAVVPVGVGTITHSVWVTGEVRPVRAVDVAAKVSGRLERMRLPHDRLIEEGIHVDKGDVVAVIEHAQYAAAVRSAEAAVAVASAEYERSKVNLNDARREKARWVELRKGGSGTDRQLDQAATDFERTQAELRVAEAQVKQAEAALGQANVNLNETTIEAPIAGVVSRKYVDEGAFVGPSTPLFKIIDLDPVEITGGVADRHYPKLAVGRTQAEVEVDAYPGQKFSGLISRLRPELDRVTRTVAITIRVANDKGHLKPGMYARIRLVLAKRQDVAVVPDEALLSSGQDTRAYVVEGSRVHVRRVRIGLEEANRNEVLEGLRPGERVVVRGQRMLTDGMSVQAQEVRSP